MSISIGSTELISNQGILIRKFSISQPHPDSGELSSLIFVDQIKVQCDPALDDLLQGRISVQNVTVDGLSAQLIRERDQSWNLSKLLPLPRFNPEQIKLPTLTIVNGTIEVTDLSRSQPTIKCENVDLQVNLTRVLDDLQQPTEHVIAMFSGKLATPFCRHIELEGAATTAHGGWQVSGNMQEIEWSPELATTLPFAMSEEIQSGLRAEAQVTFHVSRASANAPPQFELDGIVTQGQWHPPRLPQPVTNVTGEFQVNNQGVVVRRLSASLGEGRIRTELHINGFDFQHPYAFSLTAKEFPVTRRLIEALPQSLQATWEKYQPIGTVSGQIQITHDGRTTDYDADVTCHNLKLTHYKYRYPITNCQGHAKFRDGVFGFNLEGLAGTTPITINGSMRNPGPQSLGYCEISTRGWKPIDDMLIRALPPKAQQFAHKLQLRGNVGFWIRLEREDPSLPAPKPHLIVALNEGWINYEMFPYPISDIRGRIVLKNGNWKIEEEFKGWNDGCEIRCQGGWDAALTDRPLKLDFFANNVTLDNELKRALRPNAQQVWDGLRPHGALEELKIQLRMSDRSPDISLDINALQRSTKNRPEQRQELAIQPTWFPYRMGDVSGLAHWRDGELTVQRLVAKHNDTTLRANLSGTTSATGAWQINLTDVAVDNLQLDNDLTHALPKRASSAINQIGANGLFAIHGAVIFAKKHGDAPLESSWDVALQLEQASLHAGQPLTNIFGEINLRGSGLGQQFWSRGVVNIDSMLCRNIQLTELQGPIWLDSTRLAIGRRVPPADRQAPSQPLLAKLYGGRIAADLEVTLAEHANFATRIQINSADVATMGRDLQIGSGNLSGKAFAELVMTGSTRGKHTFNGQGSLQLRDANMYELPIVLAVLSRMSSGKSDNTAFTNSDIAYRISNGYVYFDRFDLSGDAITLKGIGEMSLERKLNLDFYSIVGREQLWSPIVRPFLGEASRQFLQIHVDGTLDNPVTRQEVLPGLNETLQQLFPEQIAPTQESRTSASPSILGRWK
ncbi:MAG: AsmA-like C-terminal region-containing protein [Pirellulaceae bacterium]|nr:AsmA-like C-terminal region-containing protein [Pirellulaceae bacterium]